MGDRQRDGHRAGRRAAVGGAGSRRLSEGSCRAPGRPCQSAAMAPFIGLSATCSASISIRRCMSPAQRRASTNGRPNRSVRGAHLARLRRPHETVAPRRSSHIAASFVLNRPCANFPERHRPPARRRGDSFAWWPGAGCWPPPSPCRGSDIRALASGRPFRRWPTRRGARGPSCQHEQHKGGGAGAAGSLSFSARIWHSPFGEKLKKPPDR